MYQALYRKWRPKSFDDVVGQGHITETLKRQVETGRLSHAYLFVGTRGTGKTTCAKILAKAANCEHPIDGNPCNMCPSCLGIDSGAILDVEELDAASNNGVDNIRLLRDEAIYTPASVRKRVYIVDEVHMLSTAAFNALLKILEEPPEHLIFILATTELNKVPATILSRCQRFAFKRISREDVAGRLKYVAEKEGLSLTSDGAEILANLSDGSLRDALSLLDQCTGSEVIDKERVLSVVGLAGQTEIAGLFESIMNSDPGTALEIIDRLYMEGKEISSVMTELLTLYRDLLILKVAGKNAPKLVSGTFDMNTLEDLYPKAESRKLVRGAAEIEEALSFMTKSDDARTRAEMCIIMLSDETLMPGISGLEARVARLESGTVSFAPVEKNEKSHKEVKGKSGSEEIQKPEKKAEIFNDVPFDTDGAFVINKKEPGSKPVEDNAAFEERKSDISLEKKPEEPELKSKITDDGSQWQAILSVVEKKIQKPPFTFLSNEMHSVGKIDGNILNIETKSVIAKNLIDKTEVKTALKEAAEAVLKKPVTVVVGQYREEEKNSPDKLDTLMKFGNIKFE